MLTAMAVCTGASSAVAGTVGVIRVIDGDTLDVGGTRVRLHGIDAPEADQTCTTTGGEIWRCGAWVSQTVTARFGGKTARCVSIDTDRYGRMVARCNVDGQDIAANLVTEGLAFSYRRYSDAYTGMERAAASRGAGLHSSRFQSPAEFRKSRSNADAPPDGACRIKGNISSDGTRIYHVPGQHHYDRTRIRTKQGERWFCSVAEARAAGWRAARR
ncbi:thermonuclease family protein [Roseobacter denitrificans]|nr:thermonuclease family protein [Roseobacter denitrificans]AVL54612.1 thermonuclease family protein [Roseobacter denitrificans]SFF89098.1 Endonuclease YncB, thermonuclease family [Roseobacter denitrificans OCh 114]